MSYFCETSNLIFKHPVLGYLVLTGSEKNGLNNLDFLSSPPKNLSLKNNPFLENIADLLEQYLQGQPVDFRHIPLALTGTIFQKNVWSVLRDIPWGTTCSYGWIAQQIKMPKSSRAVGQANGKNPVPIIVPCHRVIRSDGSIGGYSGGLDIKHFLLSLEKIHLSTLD